GSIAKLRPGRLLYGARALRAEFGNRLLRPENIELAVGDHPSLRIRLVLCPARQSDCAITLKLRCVVVWVGDKCRTMLDILEPIGRVVIGRLVLGRTLF